MKSCRLLLIALFTFIYISLNAQVFVGGSVRFNTSNDDHSGITNPYKQSNYSLDLTPSVGTFLSEKLAIGLALNVYLSGNKTSIPVETISKSTGIGVSPFMRYYAYKLNKLSIYCQGNIGLELSNSSIKAGGITTDGPKSTQIYFRIYPGLSYDISDNFSLETSLNFLSFGYNYEINKLGTEKNTGSNFNFGAGLGNIVSVGAITVGAIYKF